MGNEGGSTGSCAGETSAWGMAEAECVLQSQSGLLQISDLCLSPGCCSPPRHCLSVHPCHRLPGGVSDCPGWRCHAVQAHPVQFPAGGQASAAGLSSLSLSSLHAVSGPHSVCWHSLHPAAPTTTSAALPLASAFGSPAGPAALPPLLGVGIQKAKIRFRTALWAPQIWAGSKKPTPLPSAIHEDHL